jgi:hypothetical protein
VEGQVRRLNDLGFAVEEVQLESSRDGDDSLRLKVTVGGRRFHAEQLRRLTGLEVGEGQATDLLNDTGLIARTVGMGSLVAQRACGVGSREVGWPIRPRRPLNASRYSVPASTRV